MTEQGQGSESTSKQTKLLPAPTINGFLIGLIYLWIPLGITFAIMWSEGIVDLDILKPMIVFLLISGPIVGVIANYCQKMADKVDVLTLLKDKDNVDRAYNHAQLILLVGGVTTVTSLLLINLPTNADLRLVICVLLIGVLMGLHGITLKWAMFLLRHLISLEKRIHDLEQEADRQDRGE